MCPPESACLSLVVEGRAVTSSSRQNYSFLFPAAVGSGIMGFISSVWVREVVDGFSSICSGLVV